MDVRPVLGDPTPVAAAARSHRGSLLWLAIAMFIGGTVHNLTPAGGLDASWQTGLNIARAQHLDFGANVVFTYGPLGFLSVPLAVSGAELLLGILFHLAAVGFVWWALYLAGRQVTSAGWAAPAATAGAAVIASFGMPAQICTAAAPAVALLALAGRLDRRLAAAVPAGLAALAGVLVLVKFPTGAFTAAAAGLAALGALDRPLRRTAEAAASFAAVLVTVWTVTGQSLADLAAWIGASLQIALGYPDAMASETSLRLTAYVAAPVLALAALVVAARWCPQTPPRQRAAILLVVLIALYGGFKEGFVRHEQVHQAAYFSACAAVLAAMLTAHRRVVPWFLALALVFSAANVAVFDPFQARAKWDAAAELALDRGYADTVLGQHAASMRASYRLSPAIRAAVGDHPVSIDPFEAGVAWAYGLHWHPVPVFQSYSAYTPALDELDARALRTGPADQRVLRSPEVFGTRNPLWMSPRYTLTLACHYGVESADPVWMLLRKAANRCGPERTVSSTHVAADQTVTVPRARRDEFVVARFTPDRESLGGRALHLLWKEGSHLMVSTDGHPHLLPRPLAGGPLICAMPGSLHWAHTYRAGVPYHRLRFSVPGRVSFAVIRFR